MLTHTCTHTHTHSSLAQFERAGVEEEGENTHTNTHTHTQNVTKPCSPLLPSNPVRLIRRFREETGGSPLGTGLAR